jgi:hypothetical protein
MPDRENFPLPDVIHPPNSRGICVPVPDDSVYMRVFAGLLQELTFWFNWQRDPEKRGKDAAKVWLDIFNNIDWVGGDCMGCCEDRIVLHRVTDDGAMEVSTDDGVTWSPDPADPRVNGTALPNTIPGTGDDKKCNGATNAIDNFKDAQAAFGHSLTTTTTVIGLALAIAAELLILLFSAGTTAEVIVPLVISTATALFGVLEADYNALFTEMVWDKLLCDIFCTIGNNGQFTETQFNNLSALVDTDFTDNVALTFQSILRGWGVLGLNNACISGVAATADCSDCDCPTECGDPGLVTIGTVTESGIDINGRRYLHIASNTFSTFQNVSIGTYGEACPPNTCCHIYGWGIISGAINSTGYTDCAGGVHDPGNPETHDCGHATWNTEPGDGTPFEISVTFGV